MERQGKPAVDTAESRMAGLPCASWRRRACWGVLRLAVGERAAGGVHRAETWHAQAAALAMADRTRRPAAGDGRATRRQTRRARGREEERAWRGAHRGACRGCRSRRGRRRLLPGSSRTDIDGDGELKLTGVPGSCGLRSSARTERQSWWLHSRDQVRHRWRKQLGVGF